MLVRKRLRQTSETLCGDGGLVYDVWPPVSPSHLPSFSLSLSSSSSSSSSFWSVRALVVCPYLIRRPKPPPKGYGSCVYVDDGALPPRRVCALLAWRKRRKKSISLAKRLDHTHTYIHLRASSSSPSSSSSRPVMLRYSRPSPSSGNTCCVWPCRAD